MIEAGKNYTNVNTAKSVTVNAVFGSQVYYQDEFGCHFRKTVELFASLYK